MQLGKHSKIVRAANAAAAGTGNVTGNVVDLQGFNAVLFTVLFGAIVAGAVTAVKLQHGDLADGSDMADIAGSALAIADTDDNKIAELEIVEPQKRFVRVVVTRATQNATVDGILARLFAPRTMPPAADATRAGYKVVAGPVSGAA